MRVSTTVLGRIAMRIDTGCRQGVAVEHYGVALEDRLRIYLMLGRHYLQSEHDDTVATVYSNERVVIRTLYGQQ